MKTENDIGYTIAGTGSQKVIMLHGWWSDHTAYDILLPILDLENFTYAFMDYRGYGKSIDIYGEHSIEEIAADALALADHLGWKNFHAVGHSMGGMAVQKMIVKAPERIHSSVLITPVPACGAPLDQASEELFLNAAKDDENRLTILNFLTSGRLSPGWYNHVLKRSHETTNCRSFHEYMQAWTGTDFADAVQGMDAPILVLVGEYDQAITMEGMTKTLLEYFPAATIDVIMNSGHFPMLETPARLVYLMEKYLKKHV